MKSKGSHTLLLPHFHHIYVEHAVQGHPMVEAVLGKFPRATIIPIRHYKDIFSRPGQWPAVQRLSRSLILAKGRPPFLYAGAEVCPSFGNPSFYYASTVMNCIFHCEYCYLQGMYPSANIVVFVNMEDVFQEALKVLSVTGNGSDQNEGISRFPLYICNSYDTDLLALGTIIPAAAKWLNFAQENPNILLEMRTKSATTWWIHAHSPLDNVIVAWTLSPDAVARRFEAGAPPLDARLGAAKRSMHAGWKIRICIDPILFVSDWEKHYGELIDTLFRELRPSGVESVSFGMFRMGKEFLKRARKVRPDSALLHYPFELQNGVYTYPDSISSKMMQFMMHKLLKYLPAPKIFPQEPGECV